MAALEENSLERGCVESLALGCCWSSMPSGVAISHIDKRCLRETAKSTSMRFELSRMKKVYPLPDHVDKIDSPKISRASHQGREP